MGKGKGTCGGLQRKVSKKKKHNQSPVTAAKTLVCFILSKQNSFCRGLL